MKNEMNPKVTPSQLTSRTSIRYNSVMSTKKTLSRQSGISLFVSGDICPKWKIDRKLVKGDVEAVFGDTLKLIRSSDLSVLSLEAPLTQRRKQIVKCGVALKGPPAIAKCLPDAGYNIACLANNHILDYDEKGLTDTVDVLKRNGIRSFGVGQNQADATKPLVITRRGKRFAFIGVAETEFTCAEDGWGAGRLLPTENYELIADTARKVDSVIVFVHGGNEFCPFPSPRMVCTYRSFVRAGASAVIGSHAHVPQGYEVYQGSPIFYSLGNFIFPWHESPSPAVFWERGFVVELLFTDQPKPTFRVTPTIMNPETGTVTRISGSEKRQYTAYLSQLCRIIQQPQHHQNLWDAWCVMRGPSHWLAHLANGKLPADTLPQRKRLAIAENMVRCESHHEVGATLLRLGRTGRLRHASKSIPHVKALMQGYL